MEEARWRIRTGSLARQFEQRTNLDAVDSLTRVKQNPAARVDSAKSTPNDGPLSASIQRMQPVPNFKGPDERAMDGEEPIEPCMARP